MDFRIQYKILIFDRNFNILYSDKGNFNHNTPTEHLCILVHAPFWHLICIIFCNAADYAFFW